MKKLIFTTAILMLIIMTAFTVCADETDYTYILNGDEAVITGYTGENGIDISIPKEIDGHSVTAIGDGAFDSSIIASVEIPEGIDTIGKNAFSHSSVTAVRLPSTVESIGELAFFGCLNLETIIVNDGGKYFDDGQVLYRHGESGATLISYPSAKQGKVYYLPENVCEIESFSIAYPESLEIIVENADLATSIIGEHGVYGPVLTFMVYPDSPMAQAVSVLGDSITVELASVHAMGLYKDVGIEHWYAADVYKAFDRGLMTGTSEDSFSPGADLTREQLVQILFNMSQLDKADFGGDTGFADAPEGRWYSPAVRWAKLSGISNGISEDSFGIGMTLTREQLAVFLFNYVKAIGAAATQRADLSGYTDEDSISPWARDAVEWAVYEGLFYSSTENEKTIAPRGAVTRAIAARVTVSFCDFLSDSMTAAVGDDDQSGIITPVPFRGTVTGRATGIISPEAFRTAEAEEEMGIISPVAFRFSN